jgi:hypothetical protein
MPEDDAVHDLQGERAEGGRPSALLHVTFMANHRKRPHGREEPQHLFITGIPAEAKFSEAFAAFEPFGRIRSLIFFSTKDGTHSGRAFLGFHEPGSGVKCLGSSGSQMPFQASSTFFQLTQPSGTLRLELIKFVHPSSSNSFNRLQLLPSSSRFFKFL